MYTIRTDFHKSQLKEKTIKGIFKDPFQIAMVVDPVREEDGVFFWIGNELSKRTGYRVYHTDESKYELQKNFVNLFLKTRFLIKIFDFL